MSVTINGDGTVSLNLRAASAVEADSAANADNADAVDGKNVIPYVAGPYTLPATSTIHIPDVDIPRQGAMLVSFSGNNGSCFIHVFRSGSFNGTSGVGTANIFGFGSTVDPGSGSFRFWIEDQSSGARLVVRNTNSYSRSIQLLACP